ncbi:hypothetical protein F7725_002300 [Dissostichus mawsoni]|uniref:Centrosomal protein of 97 kDa n=1 Tax=Dissostichus mawsoni TaxID=36200 RepID=A0A7J5Y358_DISMA|nr:hypothetical protein F7725_002300 [Dissostichus mawsoni]
MYSLIHFLSILQTLLLHGNSITTLRTVPVHLPAQLSILSLAENEIRDLNEASYLAPLHELEQLSIMSNPCVMATPSLPGFDYRPYVMSWCLSLKVLDGYVVSQKEGLKAEWLYSQGKGRSYRPGQHVQLVQYLATVCPLTSSPALETAEDAKLEKILSKQRFHQRQLMEETRGGCSAFLLDVERHSPSHPVPQGGAREVKQIDAPAPAAAPSVLETEPVMQFNTWMSCDSSHQSLPVVRSPRPKEEHIYLEDVQTDEEKLNSSMLSSESTFLPFTSDVEPQTTHSDSEDETQTFELDSLAPKWPEQPKKHNTNKTHQAPQVDVQESDLEGELISGAATTGGCTRSFDFGRAETKENTEQEEVGICANKSNVTEADRAAVKIQSWWRGQHTRCYHPMAREVRNEIRLRRMQDHIVSLSGKLDRVQLQYEEERLQRLVQEEAVKFLWKQVSGLNSSPCSSGSSLWSSSCPASVRPSPAHISAPGLCVPPVASSTAIPPSTGASFPDSGFQSTSDQLAAQEDSFLSSGTADSLKTVRALSSVCSGGVDSADCSLLEQYLSSVQQREEEAEEGISDRTETPQPSSPASPSKTAQSPPQEAADNKSEVKCLKETV